MTDNFDLKKYLAENKLMQESSSKINMNDVYFILKTYKFNPRIIDGNRITGIKAIDFGTYDEKTGELTWDGFFLFNNNFSYIEQITDYINDLLDAQEKGELDYSLCIMFE